MEINLNMLGTLMFNWIAGHVYDTDIITIDQCGAAEEQKDDGLPDQPVGDGEPPDSVLVEPAGGGGWCVRVFSRLVWLGSSLPIENHGGGLSPPAYFLEEG